MPKGATMIHGKPNLIFGDGSKPASGNTTRARSSSPGTATFANMLSQEQSARQTPMIAPSKPFAPVVGNAGNMAQMPPSGRNAIPRVEAPNTGRLSFGMEDTRKQDGQGMAMAQQTAPRNSQMPPARGKGSGTPQGSRSGDSVAARATPFVVGESFTGVATEVNLSSPPKRGLNIFRDTNGSMAMQVGKQSKKNHEVSLLTGDSTQALLQLFNEQGRRPSPPLAPQQAAPVVAQAKPAPQPAPARKPVAAPVASQPSVPAHTPKQPAPVAIPDMAPAKMASGQPQATEVGFLAAKFESGDQGIAAIGYDGTGGTSYGKFQISSKAGTMAKFITYLESAAPDIARQLSQAGPANTGGRSGKMPQTWKAIAAAEPTRFEQLQTDFIMGSHFQPAMSSIAEATGVAFGSLPPVLQEVVFSTAVQHGPSGAARIVSTAVNKVGADNLTESSSSMEERAGQELIRQIYDLRSRQFGSSTSRIRAAVQSRLRTEMQDALTLLKTPPTQVSERNTTSKPKS